MGVLNSSLESVDSAFTTLNPVIFNIVSAILILLMGIILGRILSNIVKRLLQMADLDKLIFNATRFNIKLERLIAGIIGFVIYFFTVLIALNQVGLLSVIIQWLSYVVVIAILISMALGLRDIFPNFFAGLILKRKLHLSVGKTLQISTVTGKIVKLNTLHVHVETKEKELILIPFSQLMTEKVKLS